MSFTRRHGLSLLACILSPTVMASPPQRKLVLVGSEAVRHSVQGVWLELIYREALRAVQYDFEYLEVPANRGSFLAHAGDVDGAISRVASYADEQPNLLRLGVPHYINRLAAFSAKRLVLKDGWESLANTNLRVDYRLGTRGPATGLSTHAPNARPSTVPTLENGLRKLLADHSDLYIDAEENVFSLLRNGEFTEKIYRVALMAEEAMYCYLHKKHADLVAPLTEELKKMRRNGTIELLRKQAYTHFYGHSSITGERYLRTH